jgi:hypothetical protein
MRKKSIGLLFATVIIGVFIISTSAFSVLPPKYYEKAVKESKIKATAVVKGIKVLEHYNAVDHKKVTFKLIRSFGPVRAPEEFTGRCESVNKRWFEKGPGAGGTIYYYPRKNQKVYVTIRDNGGYITSYTSLTPKLEKALAGNFKSVKTKMGTAYVSK